MIRQNENLALRSTDAADISKAIRNRGADTKSELTRIPGVGKNMAEHLTKAGFPTIESLKGKSPDEIYTADCLAQGMTVDKCALYCYRLAVHYADNGGQLPPDKQNWWDWKD